MKKIYYLATCDTCKRILKELAPGSEYIKQEIKSETITEEQLQAMQVLAGGYERLFSKRARLYRERDLKNQELLEEDYKNLILEHYTFLKRPVILVEDQIFVGNTAKTIAAAKEAMG